MPNENAKTDNNQVKTAIGTTNDGNKFSICLYVDPTSHGIIATDDVTGTDQGEGNRDDNNVPVMKGVSNSDGKTPVSAYIDTATHSLLIKST